MKTFQHTAARRRLGRFEGTIYADKIVSTHSRPKAAGKDRLKGVYVENVSTHSRPKAAGSLIFWRCWKIASFNTQPPEGGWMKNQRSAKVIQVSTHSRPKAAGVVAFLSQGLLRRFQHTAARRRLGHRRDSARMRDRFNTQPPEGGWRWLISGNIWRTVVSTHSRPKAAGKGTPRGGTCSQSFNTQPPEGGWYAVIPNTIRDIGFNTQPPEGGW